MFHTIVTLRFLRCNKQFAHRLCSLINTAHFRTKPHCVLMYAVITEWRYEPVAPGLMSLLFWFQNVIKHTSVEAMSRFQFSGATFLSY